MRIAVRRLFSTLRLEALEQLCDKIAILVSNFTYGTIEELKDKYPEQSLESIYLSLAGREEGGDHASKIIQQLVVNILSMPVSPLRSAKLRQTGQNRTSN